MMEFRRQRGFSLLEAVVAMVLISGAGYALFGWINSNIMALNHIQESNARSEATKNILEYMSTVNPMLNPAGEVSLGHYKIKWASKPATLLEDGNSLYRLALYDTTVLAANAEAQPWFEFNLRQVGYKKVRELMPF